ncbi:hypothetical protein MMC06_003706 [Schaereria dolodes]|nr:hypothetical protein [Schaereria dolodes]
MAIVKTQDAETTRGTVDSQETTYNYNPAGSGTLAFYDSSTGGVSIDCRKIIAVIVNKDKARINNLEKTNYTILLVEREDRKREQSKDGIKVYKEATNLPQAFLDRYAIPFCPAHLSPPRETDGSSNLHIIISIRSGIGEAERFFARFVQPILHAVGLSERDYAVLSTTSDKTIMEWASNVLSPRANRGSCQTVLLLSGDGGVVDLINVLLQSAQSSEYTKPVVGLLAMGTGNALANSTGLNFDFTRGLSSLFKGTPHSLPTLTVKFSPGSKFVTDEGKGHEPLDADNSGIGKVHGGVVCSWALHASLVADSDTTEYRKHGAERFQMAAKELLTPSDSTAPHHYKGKITLIKQNLQGLEMLQVLDEQEHMYILTTLVSNLEEKLTISPSSRPLDGQLRFLRFGVLPSDEIMRILGEAFAGGGHVKENAVTYEDIHGLRIDFEEPDSHWRRVCVDGKIIKVGEGGWVEVRREARDVIDLVANT